jgi:molybdenum cofactor biosynthesis enzyme
MVDISHKIPTRRSATASAYVLFSNPHPYACLTHSSLPKGDAVAVARIAGIQAAKKTADLIPLAHPGLGITGVKVDIELLTPTRKHDAYSDPDIGEAGFQFGGVKITANVLCDGKTGVEMEALTAASMSALTMYDMCKAVDKHMTVTGVRVVMKKGGKGGHWSLNGDIPDPSPASPIFETALQRRMAGVVDDPGTYIPDIISSRPAKPDLEDPPIAPEATPDFLQAAASELDLFVANTTSPTKAAEIAGLRRKHKALTARIREMQEKTQRGRGDEVEGGSVGGELRDGRVDYNVLQRLHGERRDIARRVLAWRIGGGSEIKEANENERELDVFQQSRNQFAEKEGGRWKWDAGVYGVWKEERRNGDLGEEGGERYKK